MPVYVLSSILEPSGQMAVGKVHGLASWVPLRQKNRRGQVSDTFGAGQNVPARAVGKQLGGKCPGKRGLGLIGWGGPAGQSSSNAVPAGQYIPSLHGSLVFGI